MKTNNKKKFAIVCSGGNAPGMANCVNAFTKKCLANKITPIAFFNGFHGVHEDKWRELDPKYTQQEVNNGSALIGTSRCPEFTNSEQYRKECAEILKKHNISCLVVVGGEGSYKGAFELSKLGIKVLTIPATIDNDVASTSYTIGFDTCLNKVCDVISDISDVFISHQGVAIIELMGRSCPDLTIRSAIANNATYAVTKFSMLDANGFIDIVEKSLKKHKYYITFLVTEKMYGRDGLPNLDDVAKTIEKRFGLMSRHIEVGYIQRGGRPSARDRLLANYSINVGLTEVIEHGRYNIAVCNANRITKCIDLEKALKCKRRSWNRALVHQFNKINQE